MLKRKVITAIFATLLSIFLIAAWFAYADGEGLIAVLPMTVFISMVAVPAILLYGVPVSFLSEKVTEGLSNKKRIFSSFAIHVLFGFAFIFFVGLLFDTQELFSDFNQFWRSNEIIIFASLVTSICFWLIDEGVRACSFIERTD